MNYDGTYARHKTIRLDQHVNELPLVETDKLLQYFPAAWRRKIENISEAVDGW